MYIKIKRKFKQNKERRKISGIIQKYQLHLSFQFYRRGIQKNPFNPTIDTGPFV